jgi:transcriptional regulator with XRE-family HTH domain
MILRVCRAVAAAWAVSAFPERRDALTNAARKAVSGLGDVRATLPERAAAYALAALLESGTKIPARAATAIGYALDAAGQKGQVAFDDMLAAIETDANLLRERFSAVTIATSQLWPSRPPEWVRESWEELKNALIAENEGWHVWSLWYEARMFGDVIRQELEVARTLIPDDLWQREPRILNTRIQELIDENDAPALHGETQGAQGVERGDTFRTSDDSEPTFPLLLNAHLERGTRPTGLVSKWGTNEFAAEVGTSRQAIANWRSGKSVPNRIDFVERALFGASPNYEGYRQQLRSSWERIRGVLLDGDRLQALRAASRFTLKQVASSVGMDSQKLSRAERGSAVTTAEAERLRKFWSDPLVFPPVTKKDDGATQAILPGADAIPGAEARAIQFDVEGVGPIDLSSAATAGECLRGGEGRSEDFSELRVKAVELNTLGPNRLGRASGPVVRFLSLPENVSQVRTKLFWSRINTLRILWQDHADASANNRLAGEHDDRLLEGLAASQLKDLVETINVFVLGDPGLMELDSVRPGPRETESAKTEIELLEPVIESAVSEPSIATDEARDAISEQAANAKASPESLAGRQASEFARLSLRNFVGELLRRAYVPVRALSQATKAEASIAWKGIREGTYRAIGAGILTGAVTDIVGVTEFSGAFIRFVALHAEELSAYVVKAFQNPTLVEIINWIVKFGW